MDEADIRGIEVAASWHLLPELSVDGVLNIVRGEQAGADGVTVDGDRIPPLHGEIALRYEWSDRWIVEPYIRFAARQDRLSPRDIRDVRINPAGTPGWVTANIAVDWQIDDRWAINAVVENLLDKKYRSHGSGVDAVGTNLYLAIRTAW